MSTQMIDSEFSSARRRFLIASSVVGGGLMLAFGLPLPARRAQAATSSVVNTWIQIGSDESITIFVGATEMGQGVLSGLAQIVAEELMVDWSAVNAIEAPADPRFGNPAFGGFQFTGGSTTTIGYYDTLRTAGAAAREMLITAAAAAWGIATSLCTAMSGVVTRADTLASLSYGSLAAAAAGVAVPPNPALTSRANFRLIGKPVTRLDIPRKVNGSAHYGIDTVIPEMAYAAIVHCPSLGGTCVSVPSPGQGASAVINLGNAVAVVADSTWNAFEAAQSLRSRIQWNIPTSAAAIDSTQIFNQAQQLMASGSALVALSSGDVDTALAGSTLRIDVRYDVPYVAHATMEVVNCTANVTATACEIWAPTQGQTTAVAVAASITGFDTSQISVHTTLLGGGLGRKIDMDFIAQAITVSKTIGKPVKLTWSREEDFGNDQYRPMALVRVRMGATAAGDICAWWYRNVSPSILGQRGYIGPSDVDSQAVEGAIDQPYALGAVHVDWVPHPAAVPVGFWRSVGNSINAFAAESAMDELALASNIDPVEFRRRQLIGNARALDVLNAAAAMANWGATPPNGHALGVAFWSSFGSIACEIVDVSGTTPATLRVNHVWCVVDCGNTVNPDSVVAQMQGGIVHGMTAALWGKVTFANGTASARNFNNYRMMRMRDMPTIDVQIIESGAPMGGVGEVGVPPIAPAIANAFARLTGQRLRTLPLTGPQNVVDSIFADGFE